MLVENLVQRDALRLGAASIEHNSHRGRRRVEDQMQKRWDAPFVIGM